MKKLKFTTKTAIALYVMLAVVFLSGCNDPKQFIYEGGGLIVTGVKVGDKPERGKYIYYTKDQSGDVTIWSNGVFNIGDTLRVGKNYR
jgi:hypothetical protein